MSGAASHCTVWWHACGTTRSANDRERQRGSSRSSRGRAPRRRRPGVTGRAGELALQGREGIDDGAGFERPVASADGGLTDHAGRLEPVHSLVGGLETAPDEARRAGLRDHRRAGQYREQGRRRGSSDLRCPERLDPAPCCGVSRPASPPPVAAGRSGRARPHWRRGRRQRGSSACGLEPSWTW